MKKIYYSVTTFLFAFQIAIAQFPNVNPDWKYIRADNTGVGGEQHFVVRGDQFGNMWTGGRIPIYGQGSVVRFDGTTFTNWGTYAENYLPDEIISNIAFDNNDRIWVGTFNGLATSADGLSWQHHTSANSTLQWDQINGIAIEPDNDVWVVTSEQGNGLVGGVGFYNGTSWTFYTSSNSSLPSEQLTDIAIDQNNNKWITCNLGLIKYDGSTWTLFTSDNSDLSPGAPREVLIDNINRVWVCNGPNVDIYDGTNWTHINNSEWPVQNFNAKTMYIRDDKIILTETTNSSRIMIFDGTEWTWEWSTDFLLSCYIDIYGNYWVAGTNAVRKFDGTEWKNYTRYSTALAENSNNDIFVDSQNRKWFANGNGGIQVMDCPDWELYGILNEGLFPVPQNQSYVGTYITETPDGDLWFTYDGSDGFAVQIPDGDYQNYASWVVWDKTNAHPWFQGPEAVEGTDNGKVFLIADYTANTFMYDKITDEWSLWDYSNGITGLPTCLAARSGGKMYVGHNSGIDVYDNGVWTSEDLTSVGITHIYDIEFDAGDNMWIGSPEGLWKYDGTTWTTWNISNSNIAANSVWAIEIDLVNNIIYVGAHNTLDFPYYGGLSYFNGSGNVFSTFLEGSSPISHKQVEDLALDNLGNIWILTQGEGVNVHNPDGVLGFECIDKTLQILEPPLPVTLLNFQVRKEDKITAELLWQTATEINNRGFEIQRSFDGEHFNSVKFVAGAGDSESVQNYRITDLPGRAGNVYYRLNQIDFDGNSKFSDIVSVFFEESENINIFPNPAQQQITVEGIEKFSRVQVLDATGKLIKDVETSNQYQVNISLYGLRNAVYLLRLTNDIETQTIKFIISK